MTLTLNFQGQQHEVTVLARKPFLKISIGGRVHVVDEAADGSLTVDGVARHFDREVSGSAAHVWMDGRQRMAELVDPREAARAAAGGDDEVRAPMPGVIVVVEAQPGAEVRRGDTLVTIESMKLQTNLCAPRDGTVGEILKQEGELFDKDELLAKLVSQESE